MLHTDMEVYKLSMLLVKSIYEYCASFPRQEEYGLNKLVRTRQMTLNLKKSIAQRATHNA